MTDPQTPAAGTRLSSRPPRLLLVLVVLAAVAHGGLAVVGGQLWAQVMSAVLCAACLVAAGFLAVRPTPHVVLAVAVVGMVGVASFLGVVGLSLARSAPVIEGWIGPFGIAAVILDAGVARVAAAVLRRTAPH